MRPLLCTWRYANSKQWVHWQTPSSPHVHLYASKCMDSCISFNTGLCYEMIIIDKVILFFKKAFGRTFFSKPVMGRKGLISTRCPKRTNSSVAQYILPPGSALHFCQQCSNQTKVWDFNSLFLDCKRQMESQISPHHQLEQADFFTVLRDARRNAGPASEH